MAVRVQHVICMIADLTRNNVSIHSATVYALTGDAFQIKFVILFRSKKKKIPHPPNPRVPALLLWYCTSNQPLCFVFFFWVPDDLEIATTNS
jgi:hypothetical protein